VNGDKQLEFKYDYMGRRVEKKVYTHNGSQWNLTTTRRFVYADWLLVLELDGENDVLRKYTWGLDLAGQSGGSASGRSIDDAGGIGGLLATEDVAETKDYYYLYDANGNIGQLVDRSDGSPDARYEYDAYGNTIASAGDYADDNPFRFSTKYWDDETSLGYWGYRYYTPRLGRWLSRDPLGEPGGTNLYGYVRNSPPNAFDPRGLACQIWYRCALAAALPEGWSKCNRNCIYICVETRRIDRPTGRGCDDLVDDGLLPPSGHVVQYDRYLNPDFPDAVVPDGMIRAGFPCDPRVFGRFGRSIQWVTGENEHFVFNLTASSGSNSTGRRLRATRDSCPFVNWTKRSG
jgi:RHS repeat-associated protein